MTTRIVLVLASSFFSQGYSAQADWQYTKWGMTPEQVISASAGKARRPDPAFVATHKDVPPVMGDFRLPSGETASVGFEFRSNQLIAVNLSAFSDYGTALPVLLWQTYGMPIYRESSPGNCNTDMPEWRAESSNLHIQLTELQCGPGYKMRSITYRPIYAPDQGGL